MSYKTLLFILYFSASEGDISSTAGNLYDDLPASESKENKRKLENLNGDDDELPAKRSALREMIFFRFLVNIIFTCQAYTMDLFSTATTVR